MKLTSSIHFNYLMVSLLLAGILFLLEFLVPQLVHSTIWTIFGFMAGLSYLLSVVTGWLYRKSPENFFALKILGMLIRTLSATGFIGILVVMGLENIILFIANFFIIFLFYMIFDIYTFISNLRPNSK
jgi:L-asparagine transporter-like permease